MGKIICNGGMFAVCAVHNKDFNKCIVAVYDKRTAFMDYILERLLHHYKKDIYNNERVT